MKTVNSGLNVVGSQILAVSVQPAIRMPEKRRQPKAQGHHDWVYTRIKGVSIIGYSSPSKYLVVLITFPNAAARIALAVHRPMKSGYVGSSTNCPNGYVFRNLVFIMEILRAGRVASTPMNEKFPPGSNATVPER